MNVWPARYSDKYATKRKAKAGVPRSFLNKAMAADKLMPKSVMISINSETENPSRLEKIRFGFAQKSPGSSWGL